MLSILSHAARRATPEKFRARPWVVGRQNLTRAQISDADDVLELLWLLFTAVQVVVRRRHDLVIENLLLRHQLAVLTRPTRRRPHGSASPLGQAAVDTRLPVLRRLAPASGL